MVDALKDRVLTLKHLALLKEDTSLKILAQKDAETMLEISQKFDLKDKYHTPHFRLGEISMLMANYKKATEYYKKALGTYEGPLSEKGDYRYHLGEAFYEMGAKDKGKKTILEGLEEIKKGSSDVDPFLIHVWESGAHMRLADLLRKDNPKLAKEHFKKARKIAKSDEKLVIRRRQIRELAKSFNF